MQQFIKWKENRTGNDSTVPPKIMPMMKSRQIWKASTFINAKEVLQTAPTHEQTPSEEYFARISRIESNSDLSASLHFYNMQFLFVASVSLERISTHHECPHQEQ